MQITPPNQNTEMNMENSFEGMDSDLKNLGENTSFQRQNFSGSIEIDNSLRKEDGDQSETIGSQLDDAG